MKEKVLVTVLALPFSVIGLYAKAPVILQGPYVGAATITRSSASIAWATDIPSTTKIKWGTSAGTLNKVSAPFGGADVLIQVHNWYTYGTPANTLIYFQVCSTADSVETCSPTKTYTSSAQQTVPADPIPPAPVDTPTAPTGKVHTVGPDCNDPKTGLVAMWAAASRGDIVEINPAITPLCAGSYTFPAKPSGPPYILTRVKDAATIFPNHRRANFDDRSRLPRFVHNGPNIAMEGGGDPTLEPCYAGTLRWRQYQKNAWAMYRCNNTNHAKITAITSSGNVRVTAPGHGLRVGSWSVARGTLLSVSMTANHGTAVFSSPPGLAVGAPFSISHSIGGKLDYPFNVLTASGNTITFFGVAPDAHYSQAETTLQTSKSLGWVSGVTGPGADAVNGPWLLSALDANTLELQSPVGGIAQAKGVAVGGTVSINKFQLEPVTEGPGGPPRNCTFGSWYHKQAGSGSEDEYHRTWYCDATNEWIFLRQDPYHANPTMPVIDIATNKLDHLMFEGLNFEPMHQKADPQRVQFQASVTLFPSGFTYWSYLGQSIYNHHIYWDNIVAGCPDPSLTGEMERCDALSLDMSGKHIHIGGSYLYGFQLWHSPWDLEDDSAVVIPIFQGGPFEMINNYLGCAGICVYAPDDIATTADVYDWTLRRNTIETPDKYWNPSGPLLTQGFYFSQRHRSEWKHIHRVLNDGNIYIGGWVWNNNAAGYCFCTRSSNARTAVQSIADNVVTGFEPSATSHGWMFNDLRAGDLVYFPSTFGDANGPCAAVVGKIYTVSSVSDFTHITISPGTGCKGSGMARIMRLNAPSASISDILIRNQTWLHNPTDLVWLGHDSYPNAIGSVLARVKLTNNLSVGLDGRRVGRGAFFANRDGAPAGSHLNLGEGGEDLQESHETIIGRTKDSHIAMDYGNGGASQASGLKMTDNIFEYFPGGAAWTDGVAYGKAFLDREWVGTTPPYKLEQNLILRKGGCGGGGAWDPCAPPPGPMPFGPYPSGVLWYDTQSGPFPFVNAAEGNYRLKPSSPYGKNGRHRATDGTDIGVDMDALEAAQGKVSNVRAAEVTSTTATIEFLAPDAVSCPVMWSADNWASSTMVAGASTGQRTQKVALTGLPPHHPVQYRVVCVVMQPSGTFTTP